MTAPLTIVPNDDPQERCRSCFWYEHNVIFDAGKCHLTPRHVEVDPGHWCSHHATLDGNDVVRTFE